jgi:ketosteroid isomerase-like protein
MLAVSTACSRPSDEVIIRNAIDEMQAALENGKPSDFMSHIADDFTGLDGGVDSASLHNLLRAQVLANSRITITKGPIDVELHGDRATVRFSATVTGGNARWLPERGSVQQLTSGWRRVGADWKCINAQWERTL